MEFIKQHKLRLFGTSIIEVVGAEREMGIELADGTRIFFDALTLEQLPNELFE